ncbi:hypothetical protein [Ruminococcus sp.]
MPIKQKQYDRKDHTARYGKEIKGNTAQGTPSGFARNLLADFPYNPCAVLP